MTFFFVFVVVVYWILEEKEENVPFVLLSLKWVSAMKMFERKQRKKKVVSYAEIQLSIYLEKKLQSWLRMLYGRCHCYSLFWQWKDGNFSVD